MAARNQTKPHPQPFISCLLTHRCPSLSFMYCHFTLAVQFSVTPMALVHGPEPVSLQRLVLPLFAVDRTIQEFHDLIYDVQDMADDLDDMVLSSATLPLRTAVRHLRIKLTELQIHKLRFLCQLVRTLHLHWQQHGRPPPVDLDLCS